MHLTVTRTGGMAGITRRWSTDIADIECDPLLTALRQADKTAQNYPDEHMYEIRLGLISAVVAEHHLMHGILATLIERAKQNDR